MHEHTGTKYPLSSSVAHFMVQNDTLASRRSWCYHLVCVNKVSMYTNTQTHNIHHLLPGCSLIPRTDNVTWRSSTKFQFARMHSHKITIILSVANYIWYRTGCVATTTMLPFFKTVSNAPTENGHYPALFRLCFHRLHASHKSQCSDLAICIQTDGHCHWQLETMDTWIANYPYYFACHYLPRRFTCVIFIILRPACPHNAGAQSWWCRECPWFLSLKALSAIGTLISSFACPWSSSSAHLFIV